MTPPPSIIDQLMALSWVRDPLRRRLTCGVLALILAVLSVFPQHYVAHVKLSPQQPGEGLGGALTQLGGMAGVASALAPSPVELYLHIARGHDVLDDAINRLHLAASGDPRALRKAQLELLHAVDIESVRGGVIDVQARDASPDQARQIVSVYAGAIRDRITGLAAAQAGVKRAVLTERMTAANARMVADRAALAQFRADHDLAAPEIALGASVTQLAELEGRLQGKVVELQTAVQFAADNAIQIRQIQSQIDDLQRQISRAQGQASSAGATPSQALAANQLEYQDRFRAL